MSILEKINELSTSSAEKFIFTQVSAPDFEIVAGTMDNMPWFRLWLTSLENTLSNPSRSIIIYDSSNKKNEEELVKICSESFLNIEIRQWGRQGFIPFIMHAAKSCKQEYVCVIDVDVVFLLPDWDYDIQMHLASGVKLIGGAVRYLQIVESNFFVTTPELVTTSRMRNRNDVPAWDDNVLKIQLTHVVEFAYLTYLATKRNYKIHLYADQGFDPLMEHRCLIGDLVMSGEQEFFYHNYYSSRVQPRATVPIPEEESTSWLSGISNLESVEKNALIMTKYLKEKDCTVKEFFSKHSYEFFSN